jgi:hypothetical protein
MNKIFQLTIEIKVNIPETITPELIEEIVSEVTNGNNIPNYQVQPEKHQAFIDYIKNNESLHEQCITGNFFFKLTTDGFEDDLAELLKPKQFDETAVEVAKKMSPEYEEFIKYLYCEKEMDDNDDDEDDDNTVKTPLKNTKKEEEKAAIREIDRGIIQHCLLNYEITAASLKAVKDDSPQTAETKEGRP